MKYTKRNSAVKILWYVTNHGFGHATRSIAMVRELLKRKDDLKVTFIVQPGDVKRFMAFSLEEFKNRISFYESSCDISLKLKDYDTPDVDKMEETLETYLKSVKREIEAESSYLKEYDLLVSDSVPHAFEVSRVLKIPSVLVSNFTWYMMYKSVLGQSKEIEILDEMYSKATYSIQLAGYHEKNYGSTTKRDWYSRKSDHTESEKIRKNILSFGYEKIIYVGTGMSTKVESVLDEMIKKNEKYAFAVPTKFPKKFPNIFPIPSNYVESQNYVKASDSCVIKSGWSTVSECITMNKPTVVIERKNIPEDVNTQRFIEHAYSIKSVSVEKLKHLDFERIEKPYKTEKNDERIIEDMIEIMEA